MSAGLIRGDDKKPYKLELLGETYLPTASTCLNTLRIPAVTSKQELEKRLRVALDMC